MKAVAASLATAAVLAGAAWASNVTPQQVAKLNSRVTKLEHSDAQLLAYVNKCLRSSVGVTEYNGYTENLSDGSTDTNADALDLTGAGETPAYYFVYSKVDCAALTP